MAGEFAMNVVQAAALLSFWRSRIPPHHTDPCAGMATHTRFTLAATPNPGTFNVNTGGSVEGEPPEISRRTPSMLMSTIFDDTPSTEDISFGTSLRGERCDGRPSANPRAIDSRKLSRFTGRSIQVASRGTSSIFLLGSPTRINGRLGPSAL